MNSARLVLWDIDHTLITTGGVGRDIFADAFQEATGIPMRDMAEATGRTEPELFSQTLELNGIQEQPEYFEIFARTQAQGYRRRSDELRAKGQVLPGVTVTLDQLARTPGVIQSVLTGNTRAAARAKLGVLGLADRLELDIGAYGDDDRTRANLVRIARQNAEHKHDHRYTADNTILIGDTVRDVEAGHKGGAHVIAVASGTTTEEQLREAGAQTVLPNLADTAAFLEILREP